jgi:hypothetical protein
MEPFGKLDSGLNFTKSTTYCCQGFCDVSAFWLNYLSTSLKRVYFSLGRCNDPYFSRFRPFTGEHWPFSLKLKLLLLRK